MSDQELRDKLASEGIISEMSGELIPRWHQADFKAGWDAARANQVDGWLSQDMGLHVANIDNLIKERDQLCAEVERFKADYERACQTVAEMHAAAVGAIQGPKRGVVEDVADLKTQCEKLAAALESVVPGLQELSKILKDNALDEKQGIAEHDTCLIACGFLKGDIEEALAEYRKANK